MPSLVDHVGLDARQLASLREAVGSHTTLERVVRWGLMKGHMVADVVTQDEFT